MTTDEAAKNNGESPAAAVAEQGEDITSKKDRGVLKVRPWHVRKFAIWKDC